jgi:DNA-binding NarL/FixJ family response regulator
VLIADDHPVFRRGLREVFDEDKRFLVVAEAGDGANALKFIREVKPAVAVLDIRMPELNGLQVARDAAALRLATGFVILTNHADEELFDQAMDLGVLGFVLKENAVLDVLAAVENVANRRLFLSQSIAEMLVGRRARARHLADEHTGLKSLSPTERRILQLIATDKTSKEIAEHLRISVRTVDTHRQNISQKLNLKGSHSLLKFAFDHRAELHLPD